MLSLLLAALFSTTSAQHTTAAFTCSLRNPGACRHTALLLMDKRFDRALKAFAGKAQTDFRGLDEKEPLWEEMREVLYGPPDPPVLLSDGNYLFTACMAHYCIEKGAVVVSPKGEIISAAMFTGQPVDPKEMFSPDSLQLNIFVRDLHVRRSWRKPVVDWAGRAAAEWREYDESSGGTLPGMKVNVWLILPNGKLRWVD